MTNTKFRKRALLSSVAMLLVAFIALGSATFAWFINNPSATATGVKFHTSAASGLVIQSKTQYDAWNTAASGVGSEKFDHDTVLNVEEITGYVAATKAGTVTANGTFDLQPSSLNQADTGVIAAGTSFWKTTADSHDDEASTGTYTALSAYDGYVYAEKIYTRTTDTTSSATTTIATIAVNATQSTSNDMKSAVRVAILDKNDKLVGVWGPRGYANAEYYNGTTVATPAADGNYHTFSDTAVAVTAANNGLQVDNSDTSTFVTVLVYLEGEDDNCFSDLVVSANDLLDSLSIVLSVAEG